MVFLKRHLCLGEQPKTNGHIEQIIAEPALLENREVSEDNPSNQIVEKAPLADRISEGISVGSQWVSWGLVKGAEYTSALVGKVGDWILRDIILTSLFLTGHPCSTYVKGFVNKHFLPSWYAQLPVNFAYVLNGCPLNLNSLNTVQYNNQCSSVFGSAFICNFEHPFTYWTLLTVSVSNPAQSL